MKDLVRLGQKLPKFYSALSHPIFMKMQNRVQEFHETTGKSAKKCCASLNFAKNYKYGEN